MDHERKPDGTLVMIPPTGFDTGDRNANLTYQLYNWSVNGGGGGKVTDSSTGYDLPDGSNRCPDVAWVSDDTLARLAIHGTSGFLQGAPDLVIELRSPTDSLHVLKSKMEAYSENGVKLGWLIDPSSRTVYQYVQGEPKAEKINADTIVNSHAPGLVLDLRPIWY